MLRYVAGRLAGALAVLAVVAISIFVLFELLPGDAATTRLSRGAAGQPDPAQVAALRAELGLDRPAVVRFLDWARGFLTGDLGVSQLSGRPVTEILDGRLANSVILAIVTVVVLVPAALAIGVAAGARPGSRWDRLLSTAALAAESVPAFVVGVVLIAWVAIGMGVLPAVSLVPTGTSALDRPEVLVLPVLCLLIGLAPHPVRLVRAQMAEAMRAPYISAARANGVGEFRLVVSHAAPNAISASVQPLAGAVVGLVGGIAVIEVVFAYPGVAHELLRAISGRDLIFVQSVAVLLAAYGLLVYLLADIVALGSSPAARGVIGRGRS